MENPNGNVGLHLANEYKKNRHQYEESRRLTKKMWRVNPSRFYCAFYRSLVSLGHLLVTFGNRLERYDLLLRQSNIET